MVDARWELGGEEIATHHAWLLRLARRLASDPARAEDMVQEAWTELARRGTAAVRDVRAFLAGIVRIRWRRERADARARDARESRSARSEELPSAEVLVERLELARVLADELARLPETQRTLMLLHYQEGLAAVDIARRRGVSAGNVRAQLARARETLRARLDRRFGNGREGWAVLAVMRVGPGLAPAAGWIAGGIAMHALVKAGLGVGAVLLVGWLFVELQSVPEPAPGPDRSAGLEADFASDASVEVVAEDATTEHAEFREPAPTTSAPGDEVRTREAPPAELAHVRGRLLLADGSPAAGVTVLLHGHEANDERAHEFGVPESWRDATVLCDEEGRFELGFDPPRAFYFQVGARLSRHAPIQWEWNEILRGASIDVGEARFERAGTIVGRIVDADGGPLALDWSVMADALRSPEKNRRFPSFTGETDPATAEFRIEDLPPGTAKLSASAPNAGRVEGPAVEVRAGEEVEALIRYSGPDVSRLLTVRLQTYPFDNYTVGADTIHLLQGNAEITTAEKLHIRRSTFAFPDLDPGAYSIEIDDEKFLPSRRDGVGPGQEVVAVLKGSAAVELAVRDGASGNPLARYQVDLRFTGTDSNSRSIHIQEEDVEPPPGGVFEGLIPRPCSLFVQARGYGRTELALPDLRPNERRVLVVDLEKATSIVGRVRWADGRPATGVSVELHKGTLSAKDLGDDFFRWQLRHDGKEPARCTTDTSGGFLFERAGRGEWTLWASANSATCEIAYLEISDEPPMPLELTLPALGSLRGRVLAPEDVDLSGMEVVAVPAESFERCGREILDCDLEREVLAELDPQAHFHLELLPMGELVILLRFPEVSLPVGFGTSSNGPAGGLELGRLVLESAVEMEQDFDLGPRAPGRLFIAATLDGLPATSAIVELHPPVRRSLNPMGGVVLDTTGQGLAEPLLPGTWRLVLRDVEARWYYIHPEAITIEPGREASVHVATSLLPGRLELRAASGEAPLANAVVSWVCESSGFQVQGQLRTDANGIVETRLPAGAYRMMSGGGSDPSFVVLEWTTDGPRPATIELPSAR